ncbi:hypothetical protein Tco_0915826 [Tanacetum coccineum]
MCRNVNEELAEFTNTPSWNLPTSSYDDDDDEYSFTTKNFSWNVQNEIGRTTKGSFEIVVDSNDNSSSSDNDSFSSKDIEYVDASPPNSKLVSLEVVESVILEIGGIDDDILLTIKDDILREKLEVVVAENVTTTHWIFLSEYDFVYFVFASMRSYDNELATSSLLGSCMFLLIFPDCVDLVLAVLSRSLGLHDPPASFGSDIQF